MNEEFLEISAEQAREYMRGHEESDYLLLDVRQLGEYTQGHIPGAVHIPLNELPQRLQELPVDRDLLIYCRSGKRSRAAAVFIGSRPFVAGTVFNINGGILAWNDALVADLPRLKTYDLSGSLRDILLRAMNLERGAELYYQELCRLYAGAPWREDLVVLAAAEEEHARIIYRFWAGDQQAAPPFAEVYGQLTGDIVEGGFATHELIAMAAARPELRCQETLEVALAIECAAYDLSRNVAHHFQEHQALRQAFFAIAEAEKSHMQLVARALSRCPVP